MAKTSCSAPSFATPGKTLESAFREVIAATGFGKKALILDFGAGKLRNTLYLLQKGYRVCAVEFEPVPAKGGRYGWLAIGSSGIGYRVWLQDLALELLRGQ